MRDYTVERRGVVLMIRCAGRLTIEVTGRLKSEVDELFREGGFSVFAVDLSRVRFLDSSGIGLLVTLHSRSLSRKLPFRLLSPSEEVSKTLDLVKLYDFFEYVGREDELDLPFV